MTRDEILAMPAGREMDALVAEKVMGIPKPIYVYPPELHQEFGRTIKVQGWYCQPNYAGGDKCEWYPNPYSTDIGAAWEVVQQVYNRKLEKKYLQGLYAQGIIDLHLIAHHAPDIDCRAALLAVMEAK